MKAYAVRHKPSGTYIPRLETGKQRGGSYLEPSNIREPRLFFNVISARAFLSNWIMGIHERNNYQDMTGEYIYGIKIVRQLHRKKEDMEIVEFNLVEINK